MAEYTYILFGDGECLGERKFPYPLKQGQCIIINWDEYEVTHAGDESEARYRAVQASLKHTRMLSPID